jgi:hypothetical protein
VEVGQQLREIELQGEGVGPAVHHQQRGRIRARRRQVREVDVGITDRDDELRMRVQPRLMGPPVECAP